MSSSDGHAVAAGGHAAPHNPNLAHHFETIEKQDHAVRLGMWLFLGTEVLLFAGLFLGYTVYRYFYHDTFHAASRTLDITLGTLNTIVLITSSFTVAMGFHFIKQGRNKACVAMLAITIAFALTFLVVKSFEYSHKFHEGALPGKHFAFEELKHLPGASLFFTVYFLTTGLHAFHVIIGMSILAWIMVRVIRGRYHAGYYVPVELGGLYWHLVDLVWIFLFPLLYLI